MCKRKKTLRYYGLINVKKPNDFITVVEHKKEAIEYMNMYFRLKYFEHFERWAECHHLNSEDDESWKQYFTDCIPMEEKLEYRLIPIVYNSSNIASMIRMFTSSVPLGCSFENDLEYAYFIEKLKKDEYKNNEIIDTIKTNFKFLFGKTIEEMIKEAEENAKPGKTI